MLIMLAEDDALLAMDVLTTLEEGGHRVVGPVATVEDGVDLAAREALEVAVIDVGLRGGSGLDLARRLRELHPHLAVLFVTGEPRKVLAANDVGHAMLPKPVDDRVLLEAIEVVSVLARGQQPRALPFRLVRLASG